MAKKTQAAVAKPGLKLASVTPINELAFAPRRVYQDCVDDLREMLRQAEAGELIGFAIAAMYSGRDYIVDAKGEVDKSPTFARGMIAALDDYFSEKVHA